MRRLIIITVSVVGLLIILAAAYVLILCYPQPFFRYKVSYQNLTLYSDRFIPKNGMAILEEVQTRLMKSDIYVPAAHHRVYICNNLQRFLLFTNRNYRVGGINYWVLNGNSFLRNARIARNRLIGPSGNEVTGDRTLVYYITHEVMHVVAARKTGRLSYAKLPVWIREGYADYIAKGTFDFEENLRKFQSGAIEMDPLKSGLYLRYNLLVSYALDIRKISARQLLQKNYKKDLIEAELQKL